VSDQPKPAPAPNPRIVVGSLGIIIAVQGLYAGVEILGDGLDTTRPLLVAAGIGFAVYATLIVLMLVGAWRRASWAWTLGVIAVVLGLVLSATQILAGDTITEHGLGLLIDAGLLFYLLKPGTRAMFTA
jgi:hypothetical protein